MIDAPMSGPLPAEYADMLQWSKMEGIVQDAILAQPPRVRMELLDKPELLFRARDFDSRGFCVVAVPVVSEDGSRSDWFPLVRIHWTRLMPGASTALF